MESIATHFGCFRKLETVKERLDFRSGDGRLRGGRVKQPTWQERQWRRQWFKAEVGRSSLTKVLRLTAGRLLASHAIDAL
jgi:hypothetical protein